MNLEYVLNNTNTLSVLDVILSWLPLWDDVSNVIFYLCKSIRYNKHISKYIVTLHQQRRMIVYNKLYHSALEYDVVSEDKQAHYQCRIIPKSQTKKTQSGHCAHAAIRFTLRNGSFIYVCMYHRISAFITTDYLSPNLFKHISLTYTMSKQIDEESVNLRYYLSKNIPLDHKRNDKYSFLSLSNYQYTDDYNYILHSSSLQLSYDSMMLH